MLSIIKNLRSSLGKGIHFNLTRTLKKEKLLLNEGFNKITSSTNKCFHQCFIKRYDAPFKHMISCCHFSFQNDYSKDSRVHHCYYIGLFLTFIFGYPFFSNKRLKAYNMSQYDLIRASKSNDTHFVKVSIYTFYEF